MKLTPLNLVHWRRFQRPHSSTGSPWAALPIRPRGTTVRAQRVPVKPAFLENERNSMAHSRAPSISYIEWGISGSWMKAS